MVNPMITAFAEGFLLTMMLRGATKTLTEKLIQIHPRTSTRLAPLANRRVSTRINPNIPTFTSSTSFAVNICNPETLFFRSDESQSVACMKWLSERV